MRKVVEMEIEKEESANKNLGGEKKKKMKTKIVVLVGIALCTMLLISPALASSVDTLEIYGNANEDDTIDMRDLTYVKLIFFGKKPETELADAKYDGKINPLDFIQIKLIIVGKEKEITIVDSAERTVTVKKPIKRIVNPSNYLLQTFQSLKLDMNTIVGVSSGIKKDKDYFPESEFSELPIVDSKDYEAILSLRPDLMITGSAKSVEEYAKKLPGVPVMHLYCYRPDTYVDEVRKLGYILNKKGEAGKFIDFYTGVLNPIKEKVEGIPEGDKPKVYIEWLDIPYKTVGEGSGYHAKITMAGGNNIFSDLSGYIVVDPEDVIKRNPEIIINQARVRAVGGGYNVGTNVSGLTDTRNKILNRPELARVEAVENEKVYILFGDIFGGTRHFVGLAYMAKWFHPDLFEDLDPKAIHQEYITRFQGLPDDFLDTHGVFVYPEPS